MQPSVTVADGAEPRFQRRRCSIVPPIDHIFLVGGGVFAPANAFERGAR